MKQPLTSQKSAKLKDFFIPHLGNGHAPHMLHPKRAILYGSVFVAAKVIVFAAILLVPLQAYLLPDVLAEQERQLAQLISEVRAAQGVPTLTVNEFLETSSQLKAEDMATHAYFSHNGPDSRDFKYFLNQAGYRYSIAGENLAMGFVSPSDVVEAWVKSPLHYRNLIDSDFVEMGLGLDSGSYRGKETIFIANHFGRPLVHAAPLAVKNPAVSGVVEVLGQQYSGDAPATAMAKNNISYDKTKSRVFWRTNGKETTLSAKAYITGIVKSVIVTVNGNEMMLSPANDGNSLYAGEITLAQPLNDFFNVIIDPTIAITLPNGITSIDTIPWHDIKVVNQTPTALYMNARNFLPGVLWPLFAAERAIYILGITFFTLALLINILVEIRTQKPHVIIPTGLIIVLLVFLLSV